MRARYHGEPPNQVQPGGGREAFAVDEVAAPSFKFMFAELVDNSTNKLPEGQATIDALVSLGRAMVSDPSNATGDIPAAYTYFGQFIDHDITKTVFDPSIQPLNGQDIIQQSFFRPIAPDKAPALVRNARSAPLDLDSLFEGPAKEPDALGADGLVILKQVSPTNSAAAPRINTADPFHDLPRRPMIARPSNAAEEERDRQAIIGDPRNDENLLVAQMHVAFLRSYNSFVRGGMAPVDAQTAIRRRYQWAVLHDFLPKICERSIVRDVLSNGPRFMIVETASNLFIPIEFSTAAYRFGHSMIRQDYFHNSTFSAPPEGRIPAAFNFMFTFTALSGDLQPGDGQSTQFETLPDNWPIEWHRFFSTPTQEGSMNPARLIDTHLAPELGKLRDFQGQPFTDIMAHLAARNLLRGYLLGLPTGQSVANALGVQPLGRDTLQATVSDAALRGQIEAAGLFERTPLWYYVLAEAGAAPNRGQNLGAVGSRIVAETLWNLARFATDSVIETPPSAEELATGEFTLRGLIKIGQDANLPPL